MQTPSLAAHVVMFGRPGSGKSSLAERLGTEHGYTLIRTGELLREAVRRHDPLGAQVERQIKSGALVPDALIEQLLVQSLQAPGTERWIFDGFPRTMGQVPMLEKFERALNFRVDRYVDISISHAAAVTRMVGRRVCPVCGATYHIVNKPPKIAETCDTDGARLEQRPDDSPGVIEMRQRVYDDHGLPILDYYRTHAPDRFRSVNGEQTFGAVYADLLRVLGQPAR